MHLDGSRADSKIGRTPVRLHQSESPPGNEAHQTDRRALLRRAAVGGAIAWAAPIVLSSPAFAVGSTCALCGAGNLIANGSAESGFGGNWTNSGMSRGTYGASGFPVSGDLSPNPGTQGTRFFYGGTNTTASVTQVIDLSACPLSVDNAHLRYTLSGWLGGWQDQGDNAVVTARFRTATNTVISTAQIGPVTPADRGNVTSLLSRTVSGIVPNLTRNVLITLTSTKTSGNDNDGYADLLNFSLVCV